MKVTLEVTRSGWTWSVLNKGKSIATCSMRRDVNKRDFRGTEKASVFEDALRDYPDILDAIENESPMDICEALEYLEDTND